MGWQRRLCRGVCAACQRMTAAVRRLYAIEIRSRWKALAAMPASRMRSNSEASQVRGAFAAHIAQGIARLIGQYVGRGARLIRAVRVTDADQRDGAVLHRRRASAGNCTQIPLARAAGLWKHVAP